VGYVVEGFLYWEKCSWDLRVEEAFRWGWERGREEGMEREKKGYIYSRGPPSCHPAASASFGICTLIPSPTCLHPHVSTSGNALFDRGPRGAIVSGTAVPARLSKSLY